MIYNVSAQRMKREDERNQADGGAQARQADIAFPAQPLAAADKPAQPAQTAAERSASPAGLFSPAPAAPDNKQKKAASLIGDLSHPDFMKPIRETAGAAAGKKPAAAYVGYDFTKMLQEALDALGADLAVDGVFGPKTQAAYDDFQRGGQSALRARALPVPAQSGALQTGQNIRTRLNAIPELTKKQKEGAALVYDLSHPDFMNAVKKSAGTDAKAAAKNGGNYTFTHMLQSELNAAGYPFVTKGPLKVDGVYGPKTQAAYEEFFKNAPRLLGEGGAQATLSAARTPSADPAMRVSPDTEIIPVSQMNPSDEWHFGPDNPIDPSTGGPTMRAEQEEAYLKSDDAIWQHDVLAFISFINNISNTYFLPREKIEEDYKHNKTINFNERYRIYSAASGTPYLSVSTNEEGYIVDQWVLDDINFGSKQSSLNGCGWIATYNVLKTLGENPNAAKLVQNLESGALAAGNLGLHPYAIGTYLEQNGYTVKYSFTQTIMKKNAADADANIFLYLRPGLSGHYVAFKPHGTEDGKQTYQFFNSGTESWKKVPNPAWKPGDPESEREIYTMSGADDIRTLEEFLNAEETIFQMMISVSKPS